MIGAGLVQRGPLLLPIQEARFFTHPVKDADVLWINLVTHNALESTHTSEALVSRNSQADGASEMIGN